jgi:hypothetical protein
MTLQKPECVLWFPQQHGAKQQSISYNRSMILVSRNLAPLSKIRDNSVPLTVRKTECLIAPYLVADHCGVSSR